MLKLAENFSFQDNPFRFGPKYESAHVRLSLYSIGEIEIEKKGCSPITITIQPNLISIDYFLTDKDVKTTGFVMYFKDRTYHFSHPNSKIINKWISSISNYIDPTLNSERFAINIQKRQEGHTEWSWHSMKCNSSKMTLYNDRDFAGFSTNIPLASIKQIKFYLKYKSGSSSLTNVLALIMKEGKDIYLKCCDLDEANNLIIYLRKVGIIPYPAPSAK